MPLPKGKPGPGRPKGSPNKVTREAKELAHSLILGDDEYLAGLFSRIKRGKAPHMETMLWQYGFGKTPDTLKVEGDLKVTTTQESLRRKLDAMMERLNRKDGA